MTPKSWDTWAERFRAQGHDVIVPGWPGIDDRSVEDIRSNPDALKGIGLKQIADNYERIIRALPHEADHHGPLVRRRDHADARRPRARRRLRRRRPRTDRRRHGAAAVDPVDRHPDPRQPVRQERREAAVEAPLPLHVRQRPQPRRVGQAVGGVRRQLLQPGLLRGRAVGAQREGRRDARRLRTRRPRPAARDHGRHRPRRAAGDRQGHRQEVPGLGQPGDRGVQGVRRSHAPPRQPGRLGGDRRLRPGRGPRRTRRVAV